MIRFNKDNVAQWKFDAGDLLQGDDAPYKLAARVDPPVLTKIDPTSL